MPHEFPLARWMYKLPLRMRSLFRRRDVDAELQAELAYHIERATEENIARGMASRDARVAAIRSFGGVAQRIEECRDARGMRLFEDFVQDLRYAVRTLLRARGFTAAAVMTLALGVGANTAVFAVVSGVLLRPLPFPEPDRLFLIAHSPSGPFIQQPSLSDRDYLTFRSSDRAFEHVAAFSTFNANLITPSEPSLVSVGRVTAEFFTTLGVAPAIGRTFVAEDEKAADQLVVLGEVLWRARFGGATDILGKRVMVDGRSRTVIGVMPAGFSFPEGAEAWTLYTIRIDPHQSLLTPVVGRLKPGVTRTHAEAQFAAIARQFSEPVDAASTSGILPLQELLVGDVRRPLQVFAAAAVFVLLIACGNVANLLLARGSVRQREIAIRSALGASRGRMIRQLLTESLLVSLAGAAGGLALAARGVPAMIALVPADSIPRVDEIHIHTGVAAFAIAISVAASVVFGMAPAFRLTRRASVSLAPGMGRHMPEQERLRSTLVVAEIALALVLLTGAGLLLQSFLRLRSIDTGFRPRNVMTMTVDLPLTVYSTADQMKTFHQALLEQLSRGQGVVQAGAVNWRPLGTMLIMGDFQAAGSQVSEDVRVVKGAVSPGYFSTMGIRLLRGREFTSDDDASGPGVAIVSRSVARMLEPSGNAIGRRVALSTPAGPQDWLAVVGVVDDIRQVGPAREPHPAIYQPYLQVQQPVFLSHMTFAVRTTSDPMSVTPALRAALGEVDRNQPAGPIVSMEDVLAAATAEPRFNARLLGTFALLALLLALVGTYGVLAYAVAQRTHEIGVRMALGAQARALRWAVIRRTLLLSGAGVLLGTGGALLSTRLLSALLFDIEPTDPKTFSLVALLILLTALASGYVPARRATRVDPVLALRHE